MKVGKYGIRDTTTYGCILAKLALSKHVGQLKPYNSIDICEQWWLDNMEFVIPLLIVVFGQN